MVRVRVIANPNPDPNPYPDPNPDPNPDPDPNPNPNPDQVWFKDTWLKKQIVTSTLDELNSCYEVFLPSIKQRLAAARSS